MYQEDVYSKSGLLICDKDINTVAGFIEGGLSEQIIQPQHVKYRVLEVAISNLGSTEQQNVLKRMIQYGQEIGVKVKLIFYTE